MTHDQLAELLGAYALDAVEPDEAAVIEEHLATCARCRAEVAEHREVAALLGHSGADAPDGLWDRIAGTLEAAPPRLDLPSLDEHRRRRRFPVITTAVAAAAALVIAVLGMELRDQDQRIDRLQSAMTQPMTTAFEAAFDAPTSDRFQLASADGKVVLLGAVTRDGTGYLRVTPLPDLPEDRTYQLWGAAGDELVSLGVLGDDPTIVTFQGRPYSAFAITTERAGGVLTSRNQPVVMGELA